MEVVIFVGALAFLCLLANLFGVDSRMDSTRRDQMLLFRDRRDRSL